MIKTVKICDRCGKEYDGMHTAIALMGEPKHMDIPHEDLSDIDLCEDCHREYIKCFVPCFENIHKDFIRWMNKGNASMRAILDMTIEELDLSTRAFTCLKRAGFNTVEDLKTTTEEELLRVRNLGPRSFNEIVAKLTSLGLHLKEED